jgi:hypothetical protein
MGTKKALVVGINYVGTGNDLRGCINDATNMQALLQSRGFAVEMMLEKAATTAGIKDGLKRLVTGAVPGDVVVFHYSGHGSQLPSKVEADGWEEIICPIDLNWTTKVITDDTLRQIFNAVPNGVNTTVILDCCHSGDGLDQDVHLSPVKSLVAPVVAGGRYMAPPPNVVASLEGRELVDWTTEKDINASALLIAGCRSDQTSADAMIDNVPQGAATASILAAAKSNSAITYKQLIESTNQYMVTNRYEQRPELDGFSGLYDEVFLEPFGTVIAADPVATPVATTPATPAIPSSSNHSTPLIVAIGAIVLALIAFVVLM